MIVSCYSQTCKNIYSPIVTKFDYSSTYNGKYTYTRQYMGADLYTNSAARLLFKSCDTCTYKFAASTSETIFTGKTFSVADATSAAGFEAGDFEERLAYRGTIYFYMRFNAINSNLISSVCNCNIGWTKSLGQDVCIECIAGKYKNSTGNSECLDCPEFSNSLTGSTALTDCICNAGYSGGDEVQCTACESGKYSS